MSIEHIIEQVGEIAWRVAHPENYALDDLLKVVRALAEAEELIKVEMLSRVAEGTHPSDAVVTYLELEANGEAPIDVH
jgi:hypothetical protein